LPRYALAPAFLLAREGTKQRKVARMQRRKVKLNQSESNRFDQDSVGLSFAPLALCAFAFTPDSGPKNPT
jgi:hypothetical protein